MRRSAHGTRHHNRRGNIAGSDASAATAALFAIRSPQVEEGGSIAFMRIRASETCALLLTCTLSDGYLRARCCCCCTTTVAVGVSANVRVANRFIFNFVFHFLASTNARKRFMVALCCVPVGWLDVGVMCIAQIVRSISI